MEGAANNKSSYDVLVDRIEQFYSSKKRLKNVVNRKKEEFNLLKEHVSDWNFKCAFPVLEAEVNSVLQKWPPGDPIGKLIDMLDVYKAKIGKIDKAIVDIKGEQQALLQLPDRHKRKEVTDKVAIFLNNVPNIKLEAIDKVNDNIIPQVHSMIEGVKGAFSRENSDVDKNQQDARKLKKLISTYDGYVDRFDLRRLCSEGVTLADQVLKTPNQVHPEVDKDKLEKVKKQLAQCIQKFEAEDNSFKDLLASLECEYTSIWEEDYTTLEETLKKGAFHEPTPSSLLRSHFETAKKTKHRDIDHAILKYSKKIRDFFSNDIKNLHDEYHSRNDLRNLIAKMDRKVAEDKKKLYILIAEIVAVIAVLVTITVLGIWIHVLIGLVIIGVIAGYFYFK